MEGNDVIGKMTRRFAAAAALAVGIAAAATGTAGAHDAKYDTTVNLTYSSKSGVLTVGVKSERNGCAKTRSVKIFKVKKGADLLVDRVKTKKGKKSVELDKSGRFYARVSRKVKGSYGHTHVCAAGRSAAVKV